MLFALVGIMHMKCSEQCLAASECLIAVVVGRIIDYYSYLVLQIVSHQALLIICTIKIFTLIQVWMQETGIYNCLNCW